MKNLRYEHLSDQIVAAFEDTSVSSWKTFNELTDVAACEMSSEEWAELSARLGYDLTNHQWTDRKGDSPK